jgi:transcriptional regulator with XRE-family HTH domain
MPADMKRFAQRITELRGSLTKAQVARRAGISPAYLTTLEQGTAGKVSVPVVRGIADAIPGASRVELLELAGYEEDAIYDRVQEARSAVEATSGSVAAFAGKVDQLSDKERRIVERLVDEMLGEE